MNCRAHLRLIQVRHRRKHHYNYISPFAARHHSIYIMWLMAELIVSAYIVDCARNVAAMVCVLGCSPSKMVWAQRSWLHHHWADEFCRSHTLFCSGSLAAAITNQNILQMQTKKMTHLIRFHTIEIYYLFISVLMDEL